MRPRIMTPQEAEKKTVEAIGLLGVGQCPEGAIPVGGRVRKVFQETTGHPVGSIGTVLGSLVIPEDVRDRPDAKYFYCIKWDHSRIPSHCASYKIEELDDGAEATG